MENRVGHGVLRIATGVLGIGWEASRRVCSALRHACDTNAFAPIFLVSLRGTRHTGGQSALSCSRWHEAAAHTLRC